MDISSISSCKPEPSPPFDELQRFAAAETAGGGAGGSGAGGGAGTTGSGSIAALAATLGGAGGAGSTRVVFAPGNSVIVTAPGDLLHLTGVVESVGADGEEVRVAPRHEELPQLANGQRC
jgi:hypothetical protein